MEISNMIETTNPKKEKALTRGVNYRSNHPSDLQRVLLRSSSNYNFFHTVEVIISNIEITMPITTTEKKSLPI
eukprot:c17682_g3_i1 orf=270-488(-)